jgi:tetratricopeptide (TPR) repeat protein
MEAARREMARGEYKDSRTRLARIGARDAGDGEALFRLGVCESELGRPGEARAAWEKVPTSSPYAGQAAVARARQELLLHRFAAAEELMPRAVADRGPHATEALETLVQLAKIEGRFDEVRKLVRWSWDRYPDRVGVLRELAQVESLNPFSVAKTREALERASRSAPDDDRVWLGCANLATRTGRFDEAAGWLRRCEARRPDDPAVWRGWLDLALASQDASAALRALRRFPDDCFEPAEVLSLRAWFASREGDRERERRALADLVALEPSNLRALERLAELELGAGRERDAARLRARKAELDRAKSQYHILLFGPDPLRHAASMARLAETLERSLEARILWGLAVTGTPGNPTAAAGLARASRRTPPAAPPRTTLAQLIHDLTATRKIEASTAPIAAAPSHFWFVDATEAAGLRFSFLNGVSSLRQLPETMSGGVGLLDYDGDGWLDVYAVQGGPFPPDPKALCGDRLFRNKGDGTFEDATEAAGITRLAGGYGHGVAVGDVDNDGHPDLFITRWRGYALYHNKGDRTFEDVTEAAGLGGARDWPTSAAFADLDGDGDLDLYVCHYLEWDSDHPRPCTNPLRRVPVYCGPTFFRRTADHVLRNDGGRFVDVSAEAGFNDPHGQGLGVVACDFDEDGRVDVFVANDQSANYLFRNLGDFRFEEVGESSGVASSADGAYLASMGVACGDVDGDGQPDLAVTEFYNEGTILFHNLGGMVFADHSRPAGLTTATRYMLGFGAAFLDADADGRLDLVQANGHVDDFSPAEPYQMPAQLLAGRPGGRFVDVTASAGPPWQVARVGRGLATGDVDNDGRVDMLVLSQNAPIAYFHNRTQGGHWLILRLEGAASNRDAVGARVRVVASGRRQSTWRFGGGSYQSASDPRLHFGLGEALRAEEVEVRWPSGRVDRYRGLPADTGHLLREGEASPRPLAGFTR